MVEKKLKILAASDLHSDLKSAEKLAERAKKEKVDLVLLLGDLNDDYSEGDVILPFKKQNLRLALVPGNWESQTEIDLLCKYHNLKNLDGYYINYHDVDIVGFGSPNFDLFPDDKKSFEKLNRNFERIKLKNGKKVLVSHLNAAGTKSEKFGIPGNLALRRAIDEFKPDIFISGHIHQAEGIEEKIGKTKVFHIGKKGKIFEI